MILNAKPDPSNMTCNVCWKCLARSREIIYPSRRHIDLPWVGTMTLFITTPFGQTQCFLAHLRSSTLGFNPVKYSMHFSKLVQKAYFSMG